jgi:hypothetical protein
MEPEGSLLCSQQPITGPYTKSFFRVHILAPYFFKIHFNIVLQSTARSTS